MCCAVASLVLRSGKFIESKNFTVSYDPLYYLDIKSDMRTYKVQRNQEIYLIVTDTPLLLWQPIGLFQVIRGTEVASVSNFWMITSDALALIYIFFCNFPNIDGATQKKTLQIGNKLNDSFCCRAWEQFLSCLYTTGVEHMLWLLVIVFVLLMANNLMTSDMDILSVLPIHCQGNTPVTGGFLSQSPMGFWFVCLLVCCKH